MEGKQNVQSANKYMLTNKKKKAALRKPVNRILQSVLTALAIRFLAFYASRPS